MYLEYNELLKKYKVAERNYNETLEEKSKLILAVLPKATQAKEIMVSGTHPSPDTDLINYASKIDDVDKLINQSRNTRDMLNYELKKKLNQMRESEDVYDKIYIYRWIEHKSVYKFYKLVGYSRPQVYRFITEMKEKLYPKIEKNEENEK